MKFESKRLKDCKYKIGITLDEARANGEVISLGESEEIRAINRLKNVKISSKSISDLYFERKNIKKQPDCRENRKKIEEINKKIDNLLFIPEIVHVTFNDTRHYKNIIDKGLYINNKKYVRLLTGAGMARRSTVQFVEEEFGKTLYPILEN